jgi:hypothetical protein
MPRYEHSDISFDYPRDWQDKSIVVVAAQEPLGSFAPNTVMTRDQRQEGESMKLYADRQFIEVARRLDGFELLERGELMLDGVVATDMKFNWQGSQGPIYQRLVMIPGKDRQVLSLSFTAAKESREELQPLFDRMLASVKLARTT